MIRIAALVVAIVAGHAAPALAETVDGKGAAAPQAGPLLRASLRPNIVLKDRAQAVRTTQTTGRDQQRSWVERHPVWTGVIAGFGAGCGLTYLTTDEGGIPGRGAAAIVYGGIGAGIGALIGWSVGRNQDDDYLANRPPHSARSASTGATRVPRLAGT